VDPYQVIERINALKPQCPVLFNEITFTYATARDRATHALCRAFEAGPLSTHPGGITVPHTDYSRLPEGTRPYVFPACGHIFAYHRSIECRPCPLCRREGPFVPIAFTYEPSLCARFPSHVFNPCGHIASLQTCAYWAATAVQGRDIGRDNPSKPPSTTICPYCATELAGAQAGGPFSKLCIQTETGEMWPQEPAAAATAATVATAGGGEGAEAAGTRAVAGATGAMYTNKSTSKKQKKQKKQGYNNSTSSSGQAEQKMQSEVAPPPSSCQSKPSVAANEAAAGGGGAAVESGKMHEEEEEEGDGNNKSSSEDESEEEAIDSELCAVLWYYAQVHGAPEELLQKMRSQAALYRRDLLLLQLQNRRPPPPTHHQRGHPHQEHQEHQEHIRRMYNDDPLHQYYSHQQSDTGSLRALRLIFPKYTPQLNNAN
jgi:hypothetical protein